MPVRPASRLKQLYLEHRRFFERFEKPDFDRAQRYYQGKFTSEATSTTRRRGRGSLYAHKNITYAIADSAVAALIGSNPTVSPKPMNLPAQGMMLEANGLMEWVFSQASIRRRSATTLMDAVLRKRGIYKTGWDSVGDRPVIRALDPSRLAFDLTARDPDDLSYFLETTVMPWSAFIAKVEAGRYRMPRGLRPDSYPRWLFDHNQWDQGARVRDVGAWVTVIEFYDRESGKVTHYSEQTDEILFEAKSDYIPYSMYVLNQSGTDCLGLSEVGLVLDQQQTINDMLTLSKRIAYLQLPRILFDKGRVTAEDLNKAVAASVGAFVGIRLKNPEQLRNMAAAFFPMPLPDHPQIISDYKTQTEDDAAFVSALTKSARGEIGNARTATEMAIIEAQLKMRLASRTGNFNEALEDVAKKAFWLCQKYMAKPKLVRVSGSRWSQVSSQTLHDVEMDWRMVAHNPIRDNPAVMAETLLQVLPLLQAAPNVDMIRLVEELVSLLGLPQRVLIPEDEARANLAAAAEAEAQRALGGAAATAGGQPGAEQLPPEEQARLQEQSAAAGDGVPVGSEPTSPAQNNLFQMLAQNRFGTQAAA